MYTPAGARKKKGSTPSPLDAAAAAALAQSFGRGGGSALAALSLGRGDGAALAARSRERGGGSAAAATRPTSIGVGNGTATAFADRFPFPPSPSPAWFDVAGGDSSSPGSWDKDPRPLGGFMSYFGNQPHNFHLVGAPVHNHEGISPAEVEIVDVQQPELVDSDSENARTEKRIVWVEDEDISLMSSWIEHSTDSTCGADRGGNQYWSDVVQSYNKTAPPHRKRNLKQCKDRWHKINRWCDLFECAYVKARRVFTSGYSDQMWIDAAHKFYVADNKEAKLGPFVLIEVWKICREVTKWKTYNEELRNARKRRAFHLEGDHVDNDQNVDEMPKRPMGQKAAKKAVLAAKSMSKKLSSDEDGNSKESAINVDKFDRYSKFQEETNANRMKLLELQQKLSSEKLETTKIAHLTAQENKEGKKLEKESKMMEAYNNLISQDTTSMSDEEKAERVAAMKCLRKALFSETV